MQTATSEVLALISANPGDLRKVFDGFDAARVARYDAKSDRLWVAGNGANSLYALDPKTGQFKTIRLPSYLSYGRMISIDYTTGDLWTALSSYPNKHALRNNGLLLRVSNASPRVERRACCVPPPTCMRWRRTASSVTPFPLKIW